MYSIGRSQTRLHVFTYHTRHTHTRTSMYTRIETLVQTLQRALSHARSIHMSADPRFDAASRLLDQLKR